jgi:hypothetical protein
LVAERRAKVFPAQKAGAVYAAPRQRQQRQNPFGLASCPSPKNPLSLTPSRLPRFSANEGRPFPHAFSRQKGNSRQVGGSQIFQKYSFLISLRLASPGFSTRVKRQVWWRVARKTSSQTRLEGKYLFFRVDEGNDATVKLEKVLAV